MKLTNIVAKSIRKQAFIRLAMVLAGLSVCVVQNAAAQSRVSAGLVVSTPHTGGLSLRYKSAELRFAAGGFRETGIMWNLAARYNHDLGSWKRLNFYAFGQMGRQGYQFVNENGALLRRPPRYRVTGGVGMDLQLIGKTGGKGLFLSIEAGISVDHLGRFGASYAGELGPPIPIGIGLSFRF